MRPPPSHTPHPPGTCDLPSEWTLVTFASTADEDNPLSEWSCCDKCGKWRRLPGTFLFSLGEDDPFDCSYVDVDCSYPEEAADGEVEVSTTEEDAAPETTAPEETTSDVPTNERELGAAIGRQVERLKRDEAAAQTAEAKALAACFAKRQPAWLLRKANELLEASSATQPSGVHLCL